MPMHRQYLDHVQVAVDDYGKAKAFYVSALTPLGWALMMEFPMGPDRTVGAFGIEGKPFLWLASNGKPAPTGHVAFTAKSAEEVNAFYEAGLASGGTDNGPPGIRADYHPKYYAAYVRDPAGNNIEAVWHGEVEEAMPAAAPARRRRAPARKAAPAKKPAARRAAAAAKKPAAKAPAKKPVAKKPAPKKAAAKPARKPVGKKAATRSRDATRGRTTKR